MKLAILGATGATGRHVLEQALGGGHQVVALVRDPSKLPPQAGLTVIAGSPTVVDDVRKAVRGADAVISTLGPREKMDPICPQAAAALVEAMRHEGVKRVVWTSASGVGDSLAPVTRASWVFGKIIIPLMLKHPYANHLKAEELLKASGLEWTVLRPLQLVDKPTGRPAKANLGDQKLEGLKIARKDLAAFMLEELAARKHVTQTPMVHA